MKIFLKVVLFVCVLASQNVFAQPVNPSMRGTLLSTAANRATVYLRASEAMNNASFTSATICISIPDQSPAANPTMTVTNVHGNNLSWITEFNVNAQTTGHLAPRISGGRAYYTFFGNDANSNLISFTTTSFPFVEFTFNRAGIADTQVELVDLSSGGYGNGGGPGTNAFFFIDITGTTGYGDGRNTNVAQMFFGTAGSFNNTGGASTSNVQMQLSLTPSILKEFNVAKQGNYDAAITWVTLQEQNVSHFILERSGNSSNGWSKVREVNAKGNSNTSTTYSVLDSKVYDGISAAKTVFYRIRSIDFDGKEKIFPIRSLKFSATGSKEIGLYPNPARDGFTLTIPLVNPNQGKLRLNLVNRIGQVVHAREINASVASNYYFDIKTPGVINGEYLLQIVYDGEVLDTKKVIVQR